MAEIDGSFLSPKQKRAAVERGDTVFYPWAGNAKTLRFNAEHIMEGSSTKYLTEIELAAGWQEQADLVHKAWIRPLSNLTPPSGPVTSDVLILPASPDA